MGIIKEDILFGQIAVLNRIISQEQLNTAIEIQKSRSDFSPIAMILLEKGFISKEQFRAILETQKKRLPKPAITDQEKKDDMIFAYLAYKRGHIDENSLYECYKEQHKFAKRGLLFRVSELFVNHHFITLKAAEEIIQEQTRHIIPCPRCCTQYNTLGIQSANFQCKKCGADVSLPLERQELGSEDLQEFLRLIEKLYKSIENGEPFIAPSKGKPKESLRIISTRFVEEYKEVGETKDEDTMVEDDIELTYGISETREEDEFEEEEEFITGDHPNRKKVEFHKYDDETVWYKSTEMDGISSDKDMIVDDFSEDETIGVSAIALAQKYSVMGEGENVVYFASSEDISALDSEDVVDLADVVQFSPEDIMDLALASDDHVEIEVEEESGKKIPHKKTKERGERYLGIE